MVTEQGFKTAYAMLSSEFKGDLTAMQAETHKQMLMEDGITDEELLSGVKAIIRGRKFANFPRYAELMEAIKGNPDDTAIIALKQAEDAAAEFGIYKSVIFQDKVLQATIEAFSRNGWIDFCQLCGAEDWKFQKNEFIKLYKALLKQNRKPKQDYLIGQSEHQNQISGANKEYDIEIVDGRVKVKGFIDRVENVYLVGYKNAPHCLPIPVVKALIKQQTPQIESKRATQ